MAKENLKKVFLSASIPFPDRDRRFYDTADIVAIRDAVRALATVVIPKAILVWGGHPAITPLIRFVMEQLNADLKMHVTLYQSNFFKDKFPEDNFAFENIELIPERDNLDNSLIDMRNAMIKNNDFVAGIFIGGMEGVLLEYELFKKFHPKGQLLPIASTGAAAKIIYEDMNPKPNESVLKNYAYMDLFRELLNDLIDL
ncbi:hypothetical protein HDF18_08130 [Mucilaginibacter sp. X5P1]|uniref:SLOG domain-containing protein n=1 Tax=Mucilaginibacter sp. X5P1 TaxID=2723088 RepID=UPI001620436B|nr:hypothetical protein [Mucilaginibacter sp. X5P1]MBB6137623.1 hypothetical protein [Mucilaginibacter sp. X5P1]